MFLVEKIQKHIDSKDFPNDDDFLDLFSSNKCTFIDQEDVNWDFKDQWPFSYSDDYFLGIARIIAAFANTSGGFLIFGVHDQKRTGGHNKVVVNTDKLRQTLSFYFGRSPDLQIRKYEFSSAGTIDCLLIPPRKMGDTPYFFARDTKYKNAVWVREGHQVVPAEPRHLPLLYCRINEQTSAENSQSLSGSLPPSPRTIGKFIGRMPSMQYLFEWIFSSDEPITYIFGKGGSGKTTIAHEFASIVKQNGLRLKIYGSESLDLVLFLSAKEKSFVTGDKNYVDSHGGDFTDERTLYHQLLNFSGLYAPEDMLIEKSLDELKSLIVDFFNDFSSLIVLDDIDTLTTKNIEVGTNFLYRTLARAKRTSKILCTQRNTPVHAINASMEVPGLSLQGEYQQFVEECVSQYNVKLPSRLEIEKIASVSERRPLVVEYIIALMRTCPSYEVAFRLLEGGAGDDIRDYVFKREWSTLTDGPDSRNLLAALAILGRPVSFSDMLVILQFGEGRLKDAISSTRAMFLQINSVGLESTYTLDVLTKEFVLREAETMDYIIALRARIKNFEKVYFPEIPQISRLTMRVNDVIRKSIILQDVRQLNEIWKFVNDSKIAASIVEHPQFKSLKGYAASKCVPPLLDDARSSFSFVFATSYEPPIEHLKGWFDAERNSGIGYANCVNICDYVISKKSYDRREKMEFTSLKASALYYRGREKMVDDPVDATILFIDALKHHFVSYRNAIETNNIKSENSERFIRNTMYNLLDCTIKNFHLDRAISYLGETLNHHSGYLDPVEVPIKEKLSKVEIRHYEKPVLHRARREIAKIFEKKIPPEYWMDKSACERTKASISQFDNAISKLLLSDPPRK